MKSPTATRKQLEVTVSNLFIPPAAKRAKLSDLVECSASQQHVGVDVLCLLKPNLRMVSIAAKIAMLMEESRAHLGIRPAY